MQRHSSFFAVTVLTVVAGACGRDSGEEQPPPDTAAPTAPPAAPAGNVVEIRMTGDGVTTARYEPDRVTISPGTTLRFVNVSGPPHNISFWADSIPAGAAAVLEPAMPNAIAPLQGALLTQLNETYDVSFAGAPTGQYKGYCLPHLPLGMRIWITVQ